MNRITYIVVAAVLMGLGGVAAVRFLPGGAPHHHDGHDHTHTAHTGELLPAEGASVKIISPENDQLFTSDTVPLEFDLVRGKYGHHVHAYVNGELVGMFESEKGTLTGIEPGKHVLELRVTTKDHNSELAATDTVSFTVR